MQKEVTWVAAAAAWSLTDERGGEPRDPRLTLVVVADGYSAEPQTAASVAAVSRAIISRARGLIRYNVPY